MSYAEKIEPVKIEQEIKTSYLDYAMSVIIGRALPEVRDGLKPVHRRILFAMRELRNDYDKPYKKSARVVGDVIGKYHPHGDTAVYDALVRMAQDFSLRYPLVDGQGNFGSVDGDPPAAMRYTEARMARITQELLADIEKDTVELVENYDGSMTEPFVLPSRLPNLIINGSSGIAVGMATNIPPHNLGEVVDGLIALIHNPDLTLAELVRYIPGPDFPTAGFLYGQQGLASAYETGRGVIKIRSRITVETRARDNKKALVITELPYQVNKARVVESIALLVRDKKIDGISEIRDESDREGMRIVLEVKRDYPPEIISNNLYRMTQLEVSFGINMLAIVNNVPEVLSLKDMLRLFLEHRRDVIIRRTRFDLAKAEARAHILEGLKKALDQLDLVIELIRSSPSPAEAKSQLMDRLEITDIQAQAILDLRLQRLTGLERKAIDDEYLQVIKDIANFWEILKSEQRVNHIIEEELDQLKETYGDERRTEILDQVDNELTPEDLIVEEDMVVTISHTGYIKRNPISLYRAQRRGGRGITGTRPGEEDFVERLYVASTHSYLLFLTSAGHLHWLKVHEIPQAGRMARGKAVVNLLNLAPGEKLATVLPVRDLREEGRFVVMASKKGLIKRSPLNVFSNPRKMGIICLTINEGDELVSAALTDGSNYIFLATKDGKAICFEEKGARSMGRTAAGVRGIGLSSGDYVVGMEVLNEAKDKDILTVTANGYGKRTLASEYRVQSRAGKGLITIKTTDRNGPVIGVFQVTDEDDLMLITDTGRIIRTRVREVRVIGRNTQGVKLIEVEPDERVMAVARLDEKDEDQ
ncbi:MAG: DNA gyrase subunit A [Deltaproteobacteria bacterium]|nr:DNA gyrase subunit A [Deltaproteobacteria bacterium]MBW2053539.1 DNA gyrase subunit A [Deltaproteobacteria bacterium]MBW2141747.1 DNA gyrase subunit A [Deltaproteobacteria bacterium]